MREIVSTWGDLPDWFTGWFCEHHGDGLHQHVTDRNLLGFHGTSRDAFLEGCCEYTLSLGFDSWVEGNNLWLRLDLTDARWTWIALKWA